MWHNVVSTVRENTLPFKSLRSVSFVGKSLLCSPKPLLQSSVSHDPSEIIVICSFAVSYYYQCWKHVFFSMTDIGVFWYTHSNYFLVDIWELRLAWGFKRLRESSRQMRKISLSFCVLSVQSHLCCYGNITAEPSAVVLTWLCYKTTRSHLLALEKQIDSKWLRLRHFHWIIQPISLYFFI